MTFTKINKATARKLYNNCKSFWMTACNMRPENGILINSPARQYNDETFDNIVNAFTYYNCNHETGYYPAYYIDDKED